MNILFAATELAPYVKVGSLADFISALTKTLRQHGHSVTLALPRFAHFERAGLLVARRLTPLSFDLGGTRYTATLYDGRLPSGVDLTLLDIPGLYDREGVYGSSTGDYPDNPLRFAVFCRALAEMLHQRFLAGNLFDIVHAHDWTTALLPFYAKLAEARVLTTDTRYVLTLHNLAFQGLTDASNLFSLGIPQHLFHPDSVEFYGRINILKAGMVFADALTTVSSTYALEVQSAEHGHGLQGVLTHRASSFVGIVNGIDYSLWNPATDAALVMRYDADSPLNKMRCKTALLAELNLEMAPERPLAAYVGRLIEQKGADILSQAVSRLMRSDLSIVVASEGESSMDGDFAALTKKYPGRIAFIKAAPEAVVHRVYGGSDMIMIPSRFEPCGIVQLCGQRYGAVPVGRATGGIIDTVVDCEATLKTGSGFLFDEPSVDGLVSAMQRAIAAFSTPAWEALRSRVMKLDLSWDRPAHRYAHLYKTLRG